MSVKTAGDYVDNEKEYVLRTAEEWLGYGEELKDAKDAKEHPARDRHRHCKKCGAIVLCKDEFEAEHPHWTFREWAGLSKPSCLHERGRTHHRECKSCGEVVLDRGEYDGMAATKAVGEKMADADNAAVSAANDGELMLVTKGFIAADEHNQNRAKQAVAEKSGQQMHDMGAKTSVPQLEELEWLRKENARLNEAYLSLTRSFDKHSEDEMAAKRTAIKMDKIITKLVDVLAEIASDA